jgi:metal iron transporter
MDVFIILLVIRPNGNARILEILVGALVIIVMASYIALLAKVKPDWSKVFDGFVPSSTLVSTSAALYASIGIIGAVIMPHSLYLGSHIATIDRIPEVKEKTTKSSTQSDKSWKARAKRFAAIIDPDMFEDNSTIDNRLKEPKKLSIAQKKIHILHASWDVALSLFTFSIFINSAILVVAGAAFYYGTGSRNVSDLYDAFNLLRNTLGNAYAVLFAIALLAAGQSASITVTIAGGLVSEGFIKWKTNLFVRRVVTRLIVMIPSLAISIGVGRSGLEKTLVASQVALSFALPIVMVPLLVITSLKSKMKVEDDVDTEAQEEQTQNIETPQVDESADKIDKANSIASISAEADKQVPSPEASSPAQTPGTSQLASEQSLLPSIETISHNFSSSKVVIAMGVIVYVVILAADIFTLATL